jgi:hypothetical protein
VTVCSVGAVKTTVSPATFTPLLTKYAKDMLDDTVNAMKQHGNHTKGKQL